MRYPLSPNLNLTGWFQVGWSANIGIRDAPAPVGAVEAE